MSKKSHKKPIHLSTSPAKNAVAKQDELDNKRAMLLSVRMRFSPSGATIRDEAVDRMIEQILAEVAPQQLNADQVVTSSLIPGGPRVLNQADVLAGLERLLKGGCVVQSTHPTKPVYSLTVEALKNVEHLQREGQQRLAAAANRIFEPSAGESRSYEHAFLAVLSYVFSRMGSAYVAIMSGRSPNGGKLQKLLPEAIAAGLKGRPVPNKDAFSRGIGRFFDEADPCFDSLKWCLAQNHYVLRALGVDPGARLLSADLLRGATLYLDTNVLIAGLVPGNRHHEGLLEIIRACKALNVDIKIAHITAQEFQRAVAAHATVLRKVYDRIPFETMPKVHCFLVQGYDTEKATMPDLSINDYLDRFSDPVSLLRKAFDVEIEDDGWFDTQEDAQPTVDLAKKISDTFETMRNRPKTKTAATHDALLLRWVQQRQTETGTNTRAVTLDLTLVAHDRAQTVSQSYAITLDALLQWTAPHCKEECDEHHLAAVYASALRQQLLPSGVFFEARDFLVFADMEIETRNLPAEDVEACIRDIHKLGPSLNPGKSEDREKIAHQVQRHFADPGTKFRKELTDLDQKNRSLTASLDRETESRQLAETQIKDLEIDTERLVNVNKTLGKAIVTGQKEREAIATELTEFKEQMRRSQLLRSITVRCIILGTLLLLAWWLIGKAAITLGEGKTAFQKLTASWSWFSLPLAITIVLFPIVMGRERMKFIRWWKGEQD